MHLYLSLCTSICNEHLKKRTIPIFLGFEGIVPAILLIRKEGNDNIQNNAWISFILFRFCA